MALAGDAAEFVVHRMRVTSRQVGRCLDLQPAQIGGDGGADVGMSSRRAMSRTALVALRGREDCSDDRFCFMFALRFCLSSTLDYFWPTTTAMG
jgi:hypothetical protein